jgi:hypothetical protein
MEINMKKLIVLVATALSILSPAFAQLGVIDQDLIFVPVTPCRIFETRIQFGGTGPIAAGTTKHFIISKADSYTSQGGSATNCGLGAAAVNNNFAAAAINLTAISGATSYSWITAFPFGTTMPLASTLNFGTAQNDVRTVATVVKLNTDPAVTTQLSINATQSTEVIGDIVGYYSRPRGTNLACSNPPEATLLVAPGVLGRLAIPACATTNSYGGGSATGYCTSDGTDMASYAGTTGISECAMKNLGSTSATITAGRRCCGVPGGRPFF